MPIMEVADETPQEVQTVLARLKSADGIPLPGGLLDLPINISVEQLQLICNALLNEEDPMPLAFYVNDVEVENSLKPYLSLNKEFNPSENVIDIIYQPQAIFKVRSVTRCTGELEGNLFLYLINFCIYLLIKIIIYCHLVLKI